jgi:hypothetical protein
VYDVIPDSSNNGYFLVMGAEEVGRIDAKTGAIDIFKTPTRGSGTRRGMMDAHDRLWFGENRSDSIGMFDTRTRRFQEWKPPTPGTWPYDVTADRNGEVWSGGVQRSHPSPRSTNQSIHRVLAAGPHQRAARLRGQLDRPGHLLGGQQPRRVDREARAARHVDANVEPVSATSSRRAVRRPPSSCGFEWSRQSADSSGCRPRSARQRYDHRLTDLVRRTADLTSGSRPTFQEAALAARHPFLGYLATGLTTIFPSSFFITSADTASFNFASSSPL